MKTIQQVIDHLKLKEASIREVRQGLEAGERSRIAREYLEAHKIG